MRHVITCIIPSKEQNDKRVCVIFSSFFISAPSIFNHWNWKYEMKIKKAWQIFTIEEARIAFVPRDLVKCTSNW